MRQPRLLIRSSSNQQMSSCPQHHHHHNHNHQHQQQHPVQSRLASHGPATTCTRTSHLQQQQQCHQKQRIGSSGKARQSNVIRASEYRNLRQVVPSLRRQRDLGKVEVVTEAAKYIDHLHKTLIKRFVACGIPDSLKDVLGTDNANELNSQHIMNLVTQMAAKQRASGQQQQQQQRTQQQPIGAISTATPPTPVTSQQPTVMATTTTTLPAAKTTTQRKSLPVPASKRCVDELSYFGVHK